MSQLQELYTQKGEAHTQVEIWQARLNNINRELTQILSQPAQNNVPVEVKKEE